VRGKQEVPNPEMKTVFEAIRAMNVDQLGYVQWFPPAPTHRGPKRPTGNC
jgi:hypothetical protein